MGNGLLQPGYVRWAHPPLLHMTTLTIVYVSLSARGMSTNFVDIFRCVVRVISVFTARIYA